jgi:hypothetical protein
MEFDEVVGVMIRDACAFVAEAPLRGPFPARTYDPLPSFLDIDPTPFSTKPQNGCASTNSKALQGQKVTLIDIRPHRQETSSVNVA